MAAYGIIAPSNGRFAGMGQGAPRVKGVQFCAELLYVRRSE